MALSITEANTVSTQNFDKVMSKQVYDSHALLAKMKKDEHYPLVAIVRQEGLAGRTAAAAGA
jgi:hypothetical protein